MNERIRELAEQAEVIYCDGEYREEDLAALQKFAELIVQECGVALSPMLRDQISRGKAFELIKT